MIRFGSLVVSFLSLVLLLGCGRFGKPTPRPTADSSDQKSAQVQNPGTPTKALAENVKKTTPEPAAPRTVTGTKGGFWPRFHGPKNNNISQDKDLLPEWPEGGPKLLWTARGLGEGYATVSIADGLIYTDGNVGEETVIFALDLEGNIVWQTPNGRAWKDQYPGTRGTPTLDSGRLYHESPVGEVICLEAKNGAKVWSQNILKEFGATNITWALAESVLIDGDRLICCPGGPKASVVALDKKTGNVVWTAKSTGDLAGYATPCLAEYRGLRMVLTMNQQALIGVNADTGDLLFRHEHKTRYDVNATTPIFHDGQIFITSGYASGAEMLKLTVDGSRASVEKLWEEKGLDNHHGGLVLLDGYLYGCSSGDQWLCLEWATGKVMYRQRFVGKGSLTYADGKLYVLSERSQMGLVPAIPKETKVISQFKLPRGGEGNSWAHPVVCDGRLYVRHGDVLFAFEVRSK